MYTDISGTSGVADYYLLWQWVYKAKVQIWGKSTPGFFFAWEGIRDFALELTV